MSILETLKDQNEPRSLSRASLTVTQVRQRLNEKF